MQEILSQGWIGTLVGIAGLVLAVFFYFHSRRSGIVTVRSHEVSMLGTGAVFPEDVEVRYRGTPVARLTASTVWIWNAGKKTVRGSDVVALDPLSLSFDGEILDCSIRRVTREAIRIAASASEEDGVGKVNWRFDFLDPGDGGILEVLHTGTTEAPKCSGTIIGIPKGIRYRQLLGPDIRGERWFILLIVTPMILGGLVAILHGAIGILTERAGVPFLGEGSDPPWVVVVFGLILSLLGAFILGNLRRRAPWSLSL